MEESFNQGKVQGVSVNIAYRLYWLLLNGYELTEANMVDRDLVTRSELHEENSATIPEHILKAAFGDEELTFEEYQELIS